MGNLFSSSRLLSPGDQPYRVGIYLGSFNPIHNGHLQLARQARDQFQLDAVEIVALKSPVHKTVDFITDQDRFILNQLAVLQESKLYASSADIEMEKPELKDFLEKYPNDPGKAKVKFVLQRTLDILDNIRNSYIQKTGKKVKIDYIVGADGLSGYPQAWQEDEFKKLITTCRLLVAPRPEATEIKKTIQAIKAANPNIKLRYRILKVVPSSLSSTAIRKLMQDQQKIPTTMVPSSVSNYLFENMQLPKIKTKAS